MNSSKNRRVLVIDDNRTIHDDFRKILSPATSHQAALEMTEAALFGKTPPPAQHVSFQVDSAYQGQEGALMVKKARDEGQPYALAFVDVRMPPGWDGVETTRKIWEVDPEVQIVICTAYSDYAWEEMFESIGKDDRMVILKKPFDTVEALQLAFALTEKWWLHQQAQQKMKELERMVDERTSELRGKTAFLEAQVNSSIDGILVVDQEGKQALQNQRFVDLLKIPQHIADEKSDENRLRWVTSMTKNPEQFVEKVAYLYSHPDEVSRDEIELKDGTTLDRYSSPVVGQDGKHYGRIWTFRDITERKRAEEVLRESEERFSGAFEYAPIGVALVSPDGRWLKVNRALCDLVGYSEAELLSRTFQDITYPEDIATDLEYVRQMVAGEIRSYQMEKRYVHGRGHLVTVLLNVSLVRDGQGQPRYFVSQIQDITERKRLETQLVQSQKLETVGKLAGGIAHEFNSILTAIIGQSELLLTDLPQGSPLIKNATEISRAATRAGSLTRQLLAYGRKQLLQPESLDLNRILGSMEGMFHHLMGGEVDVRIVPGPGLQAVKADAGQIEQVIMNMVMNARDAMPHGGKLTLETANVSFDQESVGRYPELKAGDYVMLAITDTGGGMSEEVKARVFEPFFSTKAVGEGTGLGLSTCYGIVKQSGGHISVYSEISRGATFKIYLPQVENVTRPPSPRLDSADLPHGTETVLLVEDDPALREMAAALLRRLGYTVWVAAHGLEALSFKQQRNVGHIDLLFTDVVMPHMSGKELADRVRALYPQTKILFTSAYTENAIVHQGVLDQGVALLQKPFTPSALALKMREILDQSGAPTLLPKESLNKNPA
jgi:PAS domain S-box-containing protein